MDIGHSLRREENDLLWGAVFEQRPQAHDRVIDPETDGFHRVAEDPRAMIIED